MSGIIQMPFLPWKAAIIQFGSIWDLQCCKPLWMWLCLMIKGRRTQTRWTGFRKVELEQFRNKNDSSELLTITIKVAWRSLGLSLTLNLWVYKLQCFTTYKRNLFNSIFERTEVFQRRWQRVHSRRSQFLQSREVKSWTALVILFLFR